MHDAMRYHNRSEARGDIYLLIKGELSDWERGFLKDVGKRLERLTEKQAKCLDRIISKYFSPCN